MDQGCIRIEVLRKPKSPDLFLEESKRRGPDAKDEIIGFRISDNGLGFNNENMKSFQTLDSEHKISKGGRGVGRLLWLKAFKAVQIQSVFEDAEGNLVRRSFRFDGISGVSDEKTEPADSSVQTGSTVHLDGFESRYKEYAPKTGKSISEAILEHCLWYFLRPGSAPDITLEDEGDVISLNEGFADHMHTSACPETIHVKGRTFDLVHAKLRANSQLAHTIAYCADQRLVTEEKLAGKIPGLHGRISDGSSDFIYSCYVSSKLLDESARPERTGFDLPESVEGLLEKTEIGLSDIRKAVIEQAGKYLNEHITANIARSKERIGSFVSTRAPRYRPILSRIPDNQLNIDPDISERDLELALHKHFAALESELLAEGHDLMSPSPGEDFESYSERLKDYLSKADDIKKSDLANYVFHRKVILDLLEKATQRDENGKYVREELIHKLIMPMQTDSTAAPIDAGNLWLVDERLAFHDYLASDKTILSYPITDAKDTKEPDICALNVFDNAILFSESKKLPPASLEIIEIKRPLRNDASPGEEDDPIEQAVGYLRRIRKGGVNTSTGRPIPGSENTPGFCYIIADLTPKLIERCEMHELTRTADGLGYFGYKKNFQAYIEVISFDRLLNMAKERNRAFFDRLGLPAI